MPAHPEPSFGPCDLEAALGRGAPCSGPACPFWDGDSCLFGRIDLRDRPSVAAWLLELRAAAGGRGRAS